MYPVDVNNPMYYRSHPYKNQLDLPTSAWKNRQMQQFYSEIPQGKAYFQQTNKKHFLNMFNRSQIEQDKVFKEQYPLQEVQKSRIAMHKSYFRSLNVDDIEGAKPNTLISKAVKNRQKALTKIKKQESSNTNRIRDPSYVTTKQINSQYAQQKNYHLPMKDQKVYKQQEAMNKFSRNKSIMQNNSLRVLNNNNDYGPRFENQQYQSRNSRGQSDSFSGPQTNYHYRLSNQQYKNNLNDKSQKLMIQSELFEKSQKIKQLQKQLGFHKEQSFKSSYSHHDNVKQMDGPLLKLRQPSVKSSTNQTQTANQQIKDYPVQNQYQNQYRNPSKVFNHFSNNQPDQLYQNNKLNLKKNYSLIDQGKKTPIQLVPSTHNQNFRTEGIEGGFDYPVPVSGVIQNRNKSFTDKSDKLDLNIDKRNIRKYNPTFLSFQSDRVKDNIGINIQNIIH